MPVYKDEKGQRQQLTVASVRNRYQKLMRRDHLQQTFKEIRQQTVNHYWRMEPQQPPVQMHYPLQPPIQVPQPLQAPILPQVPQMSPEHLKALLQQYYPTIVLPMLPVPHETVPKIEEKKQQHKEIIKSPVHEIYFEKEHFVVFKKLIGEGAFSKVWEGLNLKTKQKIAAKQIKKLQDAETKCLKSLNSEFIIKIEAILRYKNFSFIILQYCQKNLREQLSSCDYDLSKVLTYIQQIISGMTILQNNNFIHRDLKFENILISKGTIKIADFGLAKFIGDELQVESRRCGTPYTMAPEVYFTKDNYYTPYTSKCDIWSLGVIFHQMLYQKHPFHSNKHDFEHRNRVEVKKKFGVLDDLIDRCLVFNPRERIDWSQFLQIYQKYLKVKDRYMDVEAFPIEVESILLDDNLKKQVLEDDYHYNVCQYEARKRMNEDYQVKVLNDCYTKQPGNPKKSQKTNQRQVQHKQTKIRNLEEEKTKKKEPFTKKPGIINEYPQWRNSKALKLQRQPMPLKYHERNVQPLSKINPCQELFPRYRKDRNQMIQQQQVVDQKKKDEQKDQKTVRNPRRVTSVSQNSDPLKKKQMLTQIAFIIVCIVLIVYLSAKF